MPLYVDGELGRMHPTLYEGLLLCRGLYRLGIPHRWIQARIERVAKGDAIEARSLLWESTVEGDTALFILARDRNVDDTLDGNCEWRGLVGPYPDDHRMFLSAWETAHNAFRSAPAYMVEAAWARCRTRRWLAQIAVNLVREGFTLARDPGEM